jgi:sodium/potassium-transporting ATPase subunit alpha
VGIIHGQTRLEISEQMGIPIEEVPPERAQAVVIVGSDIPKMTTQDWDSVLSKQQIVFARTSPQQKLIIVEQCQKRGEIVAVTGGMFGVFLDS